MFGSMRLHYTNKGYLTLIFENICKVMWLLWHLHITVIFKNLGLEDPHSQITSIFYFFLALICVSGSFGPKFEFTAKNIASGFFQIYSLKHDNKLGELKNWQPWNMYSQCAVSIFQSERVQQTLPLCSRVNPRLVPLLLTNVNGIVVTDTLPRPFRVKYKI